MAVAYLEERQASEEVEEVEVVEPSGEVLSREAVVVEDVVHQAQPGVAQPP